MPKRAAALLIAALAALAVFFGATPASAEGPEIGGQMSASDGTPAAGVEFTVENGAGFSETVTTGPDGTWTLPLPDSGQYTVTLNVDTLPEGTTLTDPEKTSLSVTVFSNKRVVLFPTGSGERETESVWDRVAQLTVDGLVFGLILSLGGLGLSLIYGTTGLTNFSHGELMTLGAVITFFFNVTLGLDFLLAAALALVVCAILGSLQDRGLWRPLRSRGTGLVAMLVVSIGLGILLRYVILFFFGGDSKQYASYSGQEGLSFGPVDITPKSIIASLVAILALGLASFWLLRTRMGKASRAVSDNPALASASGIDVERVINVVWILGATLAALGGIIYSLNNGVNWFQGFQVLLLIFAGITVGGLGTAFGAILGCLVVGLVIQLSTIFVPPEMKNVGALAILIVILLVRPQGILGRRERVG